MRAKAVDAASRAIDGLFGVLDRAGVRAGMANPGTPVDLAPLQAALPGAVAAARAELARRNDAHEAELDRRLADHRQHPDDVTPWPEVKSSISARIRS